MDERLEITVSDDNFKEEVLESSLPVLVDFWAEWCGPCRMIAPTIEEIASEYNGKLKVCKLNVDSGQVTASNYGVMNIPTLIIFKGGEAVEKIVGAIPKGDIISKLETHI